MVGGGFRKYAGRGRDMEGWSLPVGLMSEVATQRGAAAMIGR